jgi:hypothetical protein
MHHASEPFAREDRTVYQHCVRQAWAYKLSVACWSNTKHPADWHAQIARHQEPLPASVLRLARPGCGSLAAHRGAYRYTGVAAVQSFTPAQLDGPHHPRCGTWQHCIHVAEPPPSSIGAAAPAAPRRKVHCVAHCTAAVAVVCCLLRTSIGSLLGSYHSVAASLHTTEAAAPGHT